MAFKAQFQRPNIGLLIFGIVSVVLWLYVGGTVLDAVGDTMINTQSPFYSGLTLIGWTVNSTNHITATSGSGILSVVGIIGIASIVLSFVKFKSY